MGVSPAGVGSPARPSLQCASVPSAHIVYACFTFYRALDTTSFERLTELNKRDVSISALSERVRHLEAQLALSQSLLDTTRSERAVFESAAAELKPRCATAEEALQKTAAQLRRAEDRVRKLTVSVVSRRLFAVCACVLRGRVCLLS